MDSERQSQILIPIACRFVASDQWLTTQFDAALKISEVKRYILTKVYNNDSTTDDYLFSRDRPISPIIFASALPTPDSLDGSTESSHEDDPPAESEFRFSEPISQARRGNQRIASPTTTEEPIEPVLHAPMMSPHHYQMLAFSTGQLLEDDYSLAWYGLRPHELLELHPPGRLVQLPRDVMLEYIQPYLELDVRALRVVVNAKDAYYTPYLQDVSPNKIRKARDHSSERRGPSGGGMGGPSAPPSIRKRRKMKLEWRDRYLVIRQGMLSLFKSRSDLTPIHTCLLSSLTTLRGQEDIAHATAALPSPHIVCAKFREEVSTPNVPDPQLSSSPTADQWCDPWSGGTLPRENDGGMWGKRDSKENVKQHRGSIPEEDKSRRNSIPREDQHENRTPEHGNENLWNEINAGDGTQGIWVVLDALNEFAHSQLLRVLHRFCPNTISSTLIPSYLLPDSSLCSSPSSPSPPDTPRRPPYPYPEWRIEVSQRAQKAGLGDVSEAMSWILWGRSSGEPPAPKPCDPSQRKNDSTWPTENSDTIPDLDADDEDGDECDYELEWDFWPNDLMRQARSGADKHITVNVHDPSSAHALHLHGRIDLVRSTSNMSLSAQLAPVSPAVRHEILSSANMDLLSVDSPALLTAPSVLPFQSSGVTTSTVSVGGVVRARSLMSVDRGRRRGVARAMEIPAMVVAGCLLPGSTVRASRNGRARSIR
ncbi:hypothetical protein EI94DRAFT_1796707 [Lactarius quietus]|nr:hypothetical protein EI94DRAFT_1796707 [Lactarius quietus]